MRGIILAEGNETRLYPVTKVVCAQLLPVFDKPVIYYPLSTLMLAGLREILIISRPHDVRALQGLLGDGSQFGISLTYTAHPCPRGPADAYKLAANFLRGHRSILISADNIFYGQTLARLLRYALKRPEGATVFGYQVQNPGDYGVLQFDRKSRLVSIEERPRHPNRNYAAL